MGWTCSWDGEGKNEYKFLMENLSVRRTLVSPRSRWEMTLRMILQINMLLNAGNEENWLGIVSICGLL
jgi:hypothetical protein